MDLHTMSDKRTAKAATRALMHFSILTAALEHQPLQACDTQQRTNQVQTIGQDQQWCTATAQEGLLLDLFALLDDEH